MDNPVIVGKISDLKNKEMIQLFKDVNVLGQSINMITMLRNNSLQRSTGIIIKPNDTTLNKFNAQNVKKFVKVLSIQIYHFTFSQKQAFDKPIDFELLKETCPFLEYSYSRVRNRHTPLNKRSPWKN